MAVSITERKVAEGVNTTKHVIEARGLSTDDKPVDCLTGSFFGK